VRTGSACAHPWAKILIARQDRGTVKTASFIMNQPLLVGGEVVEHVGYKCDIITTYSQDDSALSAIFNSIWL
jgi:hypothetical protein